MATHKSAEKRNRQSKKKKLRNQKVKAAVRTAVKNVNSLAGQDLQKARELLREAEKLLSSAASKGIFHKKTVSRSISRITKALNKKSA